ncbi:MAG: PRC-barrel domain-containing protein [Pseudomonadota bacterium]|nr:PRC-barrel domain-containing protein [Pseudomonadota bacterium]
MDTRQVERKHDLEGHQHSASGDSRLDTIKDSLKGPWNWNKIGIGLGAAAVAAGAAVAARKYVGGEEQQDEFELRLETDENLRLISSKKVEGTPVVDRNGTRIGTIDNFMVDKYTGRVAYAVMSFGGTFGFGATLFPLPWPLLDYDEEKGGYRLDITKEELTKAPRFQANDEPEFSPEYRRRIILFYRPVDAA